MGLYEYAEKELRLAGFYDKDSDYDGMIPNAVLPIVKLFADEGHSGGSAWLVRNILNKILDYKPLSPLTNNSDEWQEVSDYAGAEQKGIWQSRRSPDCFSNDGGKTYYSVDDKERILKPSKETNQQ